MPRRVDDGTQLEDDSRDRSSESYAQLISDMYARWVLDCVVEVAYAVSKDFAARPDCYQSTDLPDDVVDFRSSYGCTRAFPNKAQRQDLNAPVFGPSDGYSLDGGSDEFHNYRKSLFDACTRFLGSTSRDAAPLLKPPIRSAIELFQIYLRKFNGESIHSSYKQIRSVSNLSFTLLRNSGISSVFGEGRKPPTSAWPLDANDPSGGQLISTIGVKLKLTADVVFSEMKFARLIRMAQDGRDALEAILRSEAVDEYATDEHPTDQHLTSVIEKIHNWDVAIADYRG
jgi:hypothetical protein